MRHTNYSVTEEFYWRNANEISTWREFARGFAHGRRLFNNEPLHVVDQNRFSNYGSQTATAINTAEALIEGGDEGGLITFLHTRLSEQLFHWRYERVLNTMLRQCENDTFEYDYYCNLLEDLGYMKWIIFETDSEFAEQCDLEEFETREGLIHPPAEESATPADDLWRPVTPPRSPSIAMSEGSEVVPSFRFPLLRTTYKKYILTYYTGRRSLVHWAVSMGVPSESIRMRYTQVALDQLVEQYRSVIPEAALRYHFREDYADFVNRGGRNVPLESSGEAKGECEEVACDDMYFYFYPSPRSSPEDAYIQWVRRRREGL